MVNSVDDLWESLGREVMLLDGAAKRRIGRATLEATYPPGLTVERREISLILYRPASPKIPLSVATTWRPTGIDRAEDSLRMPVRTYSIPSEPSTALSALMEIAVPECPIPTRSLEPYVRIDRSKLNRAQPVVVYLFALALDSLGRYGGPTIQIDDPHNPSQATTEMLEPHFLYEIQQVVTETQQ